MAAFSSQGTSITAWVSNMHRRLTAPDLALPLWPACLPAESVV